jgi:hypothetical protein
MRGRGSVGPERDWQGIGVGLPSGFSRRGDSADLRSSESSRMAKLQVPSSIEIRSSVSRPTVRAHVATFSS